MDQFIQMKIGNGKMIRTDGSYICHNGYKELVDCSGLTGKGIKNKSERHSKGHVSYNKF